MLSGLDYLALVLSIPMLAVKIGLGGISKFLR